jgi:hypothetical protein
MKKFTPLLILFLLIQKAHAQNNVGVGATPHASAALDVTSTNKGMLIPRLTTAQRTAIASPATGLLVFDATTESFWFKSATNWVELVDTSNNLLKKSGSNIYTTGNTQLGIGTSSPTYDLHIKQTNANIGLTDAATNKVSATITASDEDVVMNSYRSTTGAGGNIIFQRSGFVGGNPINAGNVGIGVPFTSAPTEKLQVNGNIKMQNDEGRILLHDGTAEKGEVFISGNDVGIGTSPGNTTGKLALSTAGITRLTVGVTGELNRPAVTGTSNVLPLAFGRISAGGSILSSTGNFTVTKSATGHYKITLTDESNVYNNRNQYLILVTPYNTNSISFNPLMVNAGINSTDNTVEIRMAKPYLYWENSSCSQSCGPFSYITGFKFHDEVDNEFSIVIYKH